MAKLKKFEQPFVNEYMARGIILRGAENYFVRRRHLHAGARIIFCSVLIFQS